LRAFFENEGMPIDVIAFKIGRFEQSNKLKKLLSFVALGWTIFRKCEKTTIGITAFVWPVMLITVLAFPFRKFFWYLHDSYAPEAAISQGFSFQLYQRCLKQKSLRFWFGSNATRFIWQKAEVNGELLYWSGIPRNEQPRKPKDSLKKVLSAGTGYPRKGAHVLVDAFISCVKEKKIPEDVALKIVGFSDDLKNHCDFVSEIVVKIKLAGLEKRISLIKTVSETELDSLYDESDLYVQPSFMECLPLAVLKAMSKGMPVITTDVDGCVEAIEDDVNGFTCPPRNAKILAEKLAEAINHPEKAHKMGCLAQETFNQKFSLEVTKPLILEALKRENSAVPYFTKYSRDTNKKFTPLSNQC